MPLQKSSGVAILVFSKECGVFLNITVHRATNSGKPEVKIELAFSEGNELGKKYEFYKSRSE